MSNTISFLLDLAVNLEPLAALCVTVTVFSVLAGIPAKSEFNVITYARLFGFEESNLIVPTP